MRPFVLAPQMKKVPNRIQNSRVRAASAQRGDRRDRGGGRTGDRLAPLVAERRLADVGRAVAHEGEDRDRREAEQAADESEGGPPADALREVGEERQEDELTRGGARGQKPHDETPACREPAGRHRGAEHQGGQAGSEPDHDAPEEDELPDARHGEREEKARPDEAQGAERDPPDAVPVHQRRREGTHEPEEKEADGESRRDLRRVPAELLLQRQDQHARRADGPGGEQHGQERDGRDRPAVVHVPAGQEGGNARRQHSTAPSG